VARDTFEPQRRAQSRPKEDIFRICQELLLNLQDVRVHRLPVVLDPVPDDGSIRIFDRIGRAEILFCETAFLDDQVVLRVVDQILVIKVSS